MLYGLGGWRTAWGPFAQGLGTSLTAGVTRLMAA